MELVSWKVNTNPIMRWAVKLIGLGLPSRHGSESVPAFKLPVKRSTQSRCHEALRQCQAGLKLNTLNTHSFYSVTFTVLQVLFSLSQYGESEDGQTVAT